METHHVLSVHYPLGDGEIRIRTDRDWEKDLAPSAVSAERDRFDFALDLSRSEPYLYFKPVLHRDGEMHWSQGENYLALLDGRARTNLYPHFFPDTGCSLCQRETVRSADGAREHAVRIFYPPGYTENTLARYPTLYLQDGQNVFFPQEAGGQEWQIDETLTILSAMHLIRKTIAVGIYPRERMADYTRPGYEAYGRFVVETLKPWIDARYRTLPHPRHTAAMGSSLGGVVALLLAWEWPHVFGHCACLSGTFGLQDNLLERIESEEKRPIKIYLDSGWPQDNYEVTRNLRNALRRRGYQDGRDLLYLAFPYARHNEESWAMRAHIPLQHFFST